MPDDLRAAQQAGGTWSDLFDRGSWANAVPVAAWLLVVEVLFVFVQNQLLSMRYHILQSIFV